MSKSKLLCPVIHIPCKSALYPFGPLNTTPLLHGISWTVNEGDAWAVVSPGSGGKTSLFRALLGHLRLVPSPPPPGGLYPFLAMADPPMDSYSRVSAVSFGNRKRAAGGAFYDYSARYGAVRDEEKLTLRESMFPEYIVETIPSPFGDTRKPQMVKLDENEQALFDDLVDKMGLGDLLDLPLIALSNGQTRRARIVRAILGKPELLLLDEPLTGLDITSRPKLLDLLYALHNSRSPRVILGLRTQDSIPDWITHIAYIKPSGHVLTGPKQEILPELDTSSSLPDLSSYTPHPNALGDILIDMQNVSVKYGPRTVLDNISWQIRQGEKWHLQGSNGSGKTTLLSLLTGDHPQSYTQHHLHLPSPTLSSPRFYSSIPRKRIPTPLLSATIGLLSPELFDAFPRRHPGMSVWEALGTGFAGSFVGGGQKVGEPPMRDYTGTQDASHVEREWRLRRCWHVLNGLGPAAWSSPSHSDLASSSSFAARHFSSLTAGEQRIVLLMRALVGRPPVLLLDEVWSGMDAPMVDAVRKFLREDVTNEQAVVFVTHWEEEVPWHSQDGVKKFTLQAGRGSIVDGNP